MVLIDARNGIVEQTKRHAFIASLLGIPHLVLCVNKMDLVEWSEARFNEITGEFCDFASRLGIPAKQITQMYKDDGGNLWYGMETGVIRLENPYPH